MRNAIFIHAANMEIDNYGRPTFGMCQDIINRMIFFMDKSNIYEGVDLIFIGYTGNKNLHANIPKVEIMNCGNNVFQWEFPTLQMLRKYCSNHPSAKVCYLHTQAISQGYNHPKKKMLSERRDYHLYWNIYHYKKALDHLETYDTYGAMLVPLNADVETDEAGLAKILKLHDDPVWHYTQNFWWARSDYINSLPDPETYPLILDKRHQAEFWLCSSIRNHGKHKAIHNLHESWAHAENFDKHLYMQPDEISIFS